MASDQQGINQVRSHKSSTTCYLTKHSIRKQISTWVQPDYEQVSWGQVYKWDMLSYDGLCAPVDKKCNVKSGNPHWELRLKLWQYDAYHSEDFAELNRVALMLVQ